MYGRGGPDRNTNSIEAVVFKEWKYGYGGGSVFLIRMIYLLFLKFTGWDCASEIQ